MASRSYIQICNSLIFGILLLTLSSCFAQSNEATNNSYSYTVETPEGYERNIDKQYSLLIFLHGAGERGEDLSVLDIHGPLKLMKEGKKFESIVFAPLCPKNVWWDIDKLQHTLEEVSKKYRINEKNIYLTGLSMGGYGTWFWAGQKPDQFKRIAPICGGGDVRDAEKLKDIPIWAFHGGDDKVVLPSASQEMIDAIKSIGGNPKLTIYPNANHDSWTETYDNEEFWTWLMKK